MARLILLQPDGSTLQVTLAEVPFSIGRTPGCDLVIDDPLVSRRHAVIEQADGALRIDDLDSHNGTFVNGKRVRHCVLAHGDELRIAECRLRFLATGGELAPAEALRLVTVPGRLGELELQKLALRSRP